MFLQNLFRTQKKAIRLINNSPCNTHSTPLFYKSGILKLHDINTFQVACFMYKSISGILPVYFQSFFVLHNEIHNYSTRYSNNVHINSCATQVRTYSTRNYGPKMSNEIPSKIRDSASFYVFKKIQIASS